MQIGCSVDLFKKKIFKEEYSGMSVGVALGLGVDVALHPDVYFRLGALFNQGVIKTELENKAKTNKIKLGYLSTVTGSASLNYHF